MTVKPLSPIGRSPSPLWQSFFKDNLLIRVAVVFGAAVVVAYLIYIHWKSNDPPTNTDRQKPRTVPPVNQPNNPSPQPSPSPIVRHAPQLPPIQKIQSVDQISQIPQIVGVSMAILQKRAKPVSAGGETLIGFIKSEDDLLEVIQSNWAIAQQERITHTDIADHVHFLVETAKITPGKGVPYNYKTRISDPNKDVKDMPRFVVQIFKKRKPELDMFRKQDANLMTDASGEEALITNPAVNGKYIRWTPLRERYIREFGFYALGMEIETILDILRGRVQF